MPEQHVHNAIAINFYTITICLLNPITINPCHTGVYHVVRGRTIQFQRHELQVVKGHPKPALEVYVAVEVSVPIEVRPTSNICPDPQICTSTWDVVEWSLLCPVVSRSGKRTSKKNLSCPVNNNVYGRVKNIAWFFFLEHKTNDTRIKDLEQMTASLFGIVCYPEKKNSILVLHGRAIFISLGISSVGEASVIEGVESGIDTFLVETHIVISISEKSNFVVISVTCAGVYVIEVRGSSWN